MIAVYGVARQSSSMNRPWSSRLRLWGCLVALAFALLLPAQAPFTQAASPDQQTVANGATATVTAFNICRRVTNSHASGLSIMVPIGYIYEWINFATSFVSATIPGVTKNPCVGGAVRFRAANSAYLTRAPAGAGNRRTFTFSAWVKRGKPSRRRHGGVDSRHVQQRLVRPRVRFGQQPSVCPGRSGWRQHNI
jgi:hypothetical protein